MNNNEKNIFTLVAFFLPLTQLIVWSNKWLSSSQIITRSLGDYGYFLAGGYMFFLTKKWKLLPSFKAAGYLISGALLMGGVAIFLQVDQMMAPVLIALNLSALVCLGRKRRGSRRGSVL